MTEISLENKECYKIDYIDKTIENIVVDVLVKYNEIIKQYLIKISDEIKINNVDYLKYIIISGIKTITHVFRTLLFNTKNINLSYEYCNKAVYYYIEFISQIGNENNTYLNLTPKDAGLFVYKKTIFNIVNDYIKQAHKQETHLVNELIIILIDIILLRITKSISSEYFSSKSELEDLISITQQFTIMLKKVLESKHTTIYNIKDKLNTLLEFENKIDKQNYRLVFKIFQMINKKLENDFNKKKLIEIFDKQNIKCYDDFM